MRKVTLAAVVVAAFVVASPAAAFTLTQAHRLSVRTERHAWGPQATVGTCRWLARNHHRAGCAVTTAPLVATQQQGLPARYTWTDVVTRDGGCPAGTLKRIGPGEWIASSPGGGMPHNCYTGPLVVLSEHLEIAS